MPIHEYKCASCGAVNEFLVGIGRNSDELKCPSCGSDTLERQLSVSAISVKDQAPAGQPGTTCCGSNPSETGCVPGSCCGGGR